MTVVDVREQTIDSFPKFLVDHPDLRRGCNIATSLSEAEASKIPALLVTPEQHARLYSQLQEIQYRGEGAA